MLGCAWRLPIWPVFSMVNLISGITRIAGAIPRLSFRVRTGIMVTRMRLLATFLVFLISLPAPLRLAAQATPPRLNIVIVEGEGAINNIKQRTAREPIVQVEDENHKPVAGAAVAFTLPSQGASGTFAGGSQNLTSITNAQGRAVARGFRPNNVEGKYQIRVTASKDGQTASADMTQTNAVVAGAAAAGAGISGKLLAILIVAGAAAAGGGAYAATRGGGNNNGTTIVPTTISAGTGTVGPPR